MNPLTQLGKLFSNKNHKLEVYFRNFFTKPSLKSRYGHFNPLFTRMFYFVEWLAWSVPVHNHLVFLTSLWMGKSYFNSFHHKWEKSTSIDWNLSTKKLEKNKKNTNSELGSWTLLRKLTKWLPNKFFGGQLRKKHHQTLKMRENHRYEKWPSVCKPVSSISISGMLTSSHLLGQKVKPRWPPMEGNFGRQFQSSLRSCMSVLVLYTILIFSFCLVRFRKHSQSWKNCTDEILPDQFYIF